MADGIGGNKGGGFSFDEEGGDVVDPATVDGTASPDGAKPVFGIGDGEQFNPEIHVSPDKRNRDGSFTRKRGRKAGAKPQTKKTADLSNSVDNLSKVILLAHTGIALATKLPELELDKEESDLLADASAKLLAEFDLEPDPKTQVIIGFIIACASIYGPRVALISMRKKKERETEEKGKAAVYNANGTYAGETSFSEVATFVEPVENTGTV